ncbi:glycosyltransferase family 2 protein [Alkanindiges illinoisensis]|uniref:glycosyltransferase family 2 protein n=1 Tax=Alkanindiges illinoisensis TaxID=197183 RepID=UPI0005520B80|nr:glycosyltransferase family 2 protein [Alkanindiges illinoisensis]
MNIFAVIVSFNPKHENLSTLITQLSEQSVRVILVDNASKNACMLDSIKKAETIYLESNKGIAYAQNVGIKRAIQSGARYIVFFDQDSMISRNFINFIASDYTYVRNYIDANIAAIGPRLFDKEYSFFYKITSVNKYGFRKTIDVSNIKQPRRASLIISSGMYVEVNVLRRIGFMKANYFIDYVDIEWCFRAKAKGLHCYISNKATMKHRIGDYNIQVFGKSITIHSAFRRYFRIRNTLYLLKEPYVPKIFAAKEFFLGLIYQFIIICLVKKDKLGQIKSLVLGIKDGI